MFVHGGEKDLLNQLKYIADHKPLYRCMVLRFSLLAAEQSVWLPVLKSALKTFFDNDIDEAYICFDGDVFVIGRTLTHKNVDAFAALLRQGLEEAIDQRFASLYEVGVNWSQLREMCQRKIYTLEQLRRNALHQKHEEQKEHMVSVSRAVTLREIDRDLVSSLSMRRDVRETIEIMVVEDDLFSQTLLKNTVGKTYPVSVIGDGAGAVLTYVKKAPDILFLDIGLPDTDGHTVLKEIFSVDPAAYVVMFSGHGDRENVLKAIDLGAKGFVGKPFTPDKLFQYIDKSPFIKSKKGGRGHGHPNS